MVKVINGRLVAEPSMYVESWAKGQGEKVLINKSDFDPKIHKEFGVKKVAKKKAAKKG